MFLRENQTPVLIENGGISPLPFKRTREVLKASFDSRDPKPARRCDPGSRRDKGDFLRDSGIGGVISLFGLATFTVY